jgi:hypothetical protein
MQSSGEENLEQEKKEAAMTRRALGLWAASVVTMLMSVAAIAQMPEDYLDVYIAKVKPEKRAEFDAINKKMVDANRRNKGDTWIAMETVYGETNTVTFISTRHSYADAEKGSDAFLAALNKAYGQAGAQKLGQDFNNTLISSRGEIRRRRWDLTANPPADPGAMAKMVGEARWVHSIIVHARPGQGPAFEALIRDINDAAHRTNEPNTPLISQVDTGGQGGTYYVSWLMKSLSDVDKLTPLPKMLGEEGFQKLLKALSDSVIGEESVINHFLPELSNPPSEVMAAASDFWAPKPKMAAKPKPNEGETAKSETRN